MEKEQIKRRIELVEIVRRFKIADDKTENFRNEVQKLAYLRPFISPFPQREDGSFDVEDHRVRRLNPNLYDVDGEWVAVNQIDEARATYILLETLVQRLEDGTYLIRGRRYDREGKQIAL